MKLNIFLKGGIKEVESEMAEEWILACTPEK
jgi:hypothetical protein